MITIIVYFLFAPLTEEGKVYCKEICIDLFSNETCPNSHEHEHLVKIRKK